MPGSSRILSSEPPIIENNSIPKPIIVLYLNLGNVSINKAKEIHEYHAKQLSSLGHEYHILIFQVKDQETRLEILSPKSFDAVESYNIENLKKRLKEIVDPGYKYDEEPEIEPYPDYDSEPLPGLQDL